MAHRVGGDVVTLAEARRVAAATGEHPRHKVASACRVLAQALDESEERRLTQLRQSAGLQPAGGA